MPSIRSLLAGLALTTITLLQTTTALPCGEPSVPTLPVNGGLIELAAPSPTAKLLYVTIGRGVQNYSCTAVGAAPVLIGAVANLYDATTLARLTPNLLHAIPANSLRMPTPTGKNPLLLLPFLGVHFFDINKTPVFTLSSANKSPKPIFYAQRVAGIAAPSTAAGTPAGVDWLNLEAKVGGGYDGLTVGIKQVYRVMTAQGLGGSCNTVGLKSVQYATEYWFYN